MQEVHNEIARKALHPIVDEITFISSYEMDDFILMHLEDLGFLYKKGEMGIEDINQLFGYYIVIVWENPEIKKYIDWVREVDSDIYSNFEHLYHSLKIYEEENQK